MAPAKRFELSPRSLRSLLGVHPQLQSVVKRAIHLTTVDFLVIEGLRTKERQRELLAAGASWTLNSRHITGHAVDLGAWLGTIRWELALYVPIAAAMKAASKELGVPIEWGQDLWGKDAVHFQLPRNAFAS